MPNILQILFWLFVLIFSVIIHEVSHGLMALRLGDETAKRAGRLTLNPVPHLDFYGSFLVPLLLILLNMGIVVGWAKPVPYDPRNLRNPRKGAGMIAAAGPLSNSAIAVIFGLLLRVAQAYGAAYGSLLLDLFQIVILLNIVLALFNLVPLPPLDGSKILFSILPSSSYRLQGTLEAYGLPLLLLFIFFGWRLVLPFIALLFSLIVGTPLL